MSWRNHPALTEASVSDLFEILADIPGADPLSGQGQQHNAFLQSSPKNALAESNETT